MSNRRDFLRHAALMAASLGMAGAGCQSLSNSLPGMGNEESLYKISLAEWSLHRTLFDGELDHLEFAQTAREDFGIEAVEYVNQFFKDKADDRAYLRKMKARAEDAGVRSLLIMVDGEGHLGDPDESERMEAVENHYPWVEAADYLGCHAIRVNARSEGSYQEQLRLAADGLRRLAEFADDYDISVLVENHGGLSSNGEWLAAVMERADHPLVGTLPDFGNFDVSETRQYDRYKGVREMMPYAEAVSAKSHVFDDDGDEVNTDYRRMMQIVLDAGYHGYVGIEYEGDDLAEPAGIMATKQLLQRIRRELAAG